MERGVGGGGGGGEVGGGNRSAIIGPVVYHIQ